MSAAGYSGTPLPRKLGLVPGMRVAWVGAPGHFARLLGPLPLGLVDVKVCAIDDTWSGLRLVIRKELR